MKKKLFAVALALVLLATFAACDNIKKLFKNDPIVGKWADESDETTESIIRFDDDGTCEMKIKQDGEIVADLEFIWKTDGNVLKLWMTEDGEPNGNNYHFKFEINDDELELYSDETGKTTTYKRVK